MIKHDIAWPNLPNRAFTIIGVFTNKVEGFLKSFFNLKPQRK